MKYSNIFQTKVEKQKVRKACSISASILKQLREKTVEGATPLDLNLLAAELCSQNNVIPSFLDVPGPKTDFPGNLCVSVNDETLHTIPFSTVPFKSGDIVKVDFGIIYKGIFTDHCVTVAIGEVSEEEDRLVETAKLCVETAVKFATSKNTVGDISNALQTITELAGFTSIRGYAGHGIGYSIHEEPSIPYEGEKGEGIKLQEGMLLCIENQISLGTGHLVLDQDGWTLRTKDGSKTAMFEHMVLVGRDKAEVLTRME